MTGQGIIREQMKLIDDSITSFVEGLPATEKQVFDKVLLLLKDLTVSGSGTIDNNVKNIKLISKIKGELDGIVISDKYLSKVQGFTNSFEQVAVLNDTYFATAITSNYKPSNVLEAVKKLNVETTISGLTENGIGAAFTDGIREILHTNITTGGSYMDMVSNMKEFIIGKEGEGGAMVRYARQIATDSINQYNGQYIKSVTDDLGLEWFAYTGSNVDKTRPFCKAMTETNYFHKSQIESILNGHINGQTVSLKGMIKGTNAQNFHSNRGGYNCGHQIFPVLKGIVPKEIRDKIK